MHPVAIQIGTFSIHWYGVMMALGFLLCVANAMWVGKRTGKSADFISDLLCWAMIAGVVGARAWYVFANWDEFARDPVSAFYVHRGGLVYYGGFIGAILTIAIYARVRKESVFALFDIVATGLPLAHALGRVGCFLNGCCYGKSYAGPLGVQFPLMSSAGWDQYGAGLLRNEKVIALMSQVRQSTLAEGDFEQKLAALVRDGLVLQSEARGLPVHPVQLYEAALDLLSYTLLVWLTRRRAMRGAVSCACVMAYSSVRFITEFFRGDESIAAVRLTLAQVVSICMFMTGLGTLAWLRINDRKKHGSAC